MAKFRGELAKLGHKVSRETIANILERHAFSLPLNEVARPVGSPDDPLQGPGTRLRLFHHRNPVPANRLCACFFIEVGSRRVSLRGAARLNPNAAWVEHKRGTWSGNSKGAIQPSTFSSMTTIPRSLKPLIPFFRSEGIRVIHTPYYHAPNANAYAERWVRTVSADECWTNC